MPGVIYRLSWHFRWGHAALGASQLPPASASRSAGETSASEGLGRVGVLLAPASPPGQRKSPYSQYEGVRIIPTRHTRQAPSTAHSPLPSHRQQGTPVGRPWGNHSGAGPGASSWLRVSPPARAVHPAPCGWGCEGELGIFATAASRKSQPPDISSSPLALRGSRSGAEGAWAKPPRAPLPTSPGSQKHVRLLHAALVAPPGTPLPPPRAGLGATAGAATLTRLLCRRARLGREAGTSGGITVSVPDHLGRSPLQGTSSQALSSPTRQFMSPKRPFPKLLRLFDHIYLFMEKPYITHIHASINTYMTLYTI